MSFLYHNHFISAVLAVAASICIIVVNNDAVAADSYDFGRVPSGHIIEHSFEVKNRGVKPLFLSKVDLTRPIKPSIDFRKIDFGKSGNLNIRLDTATLPDGPYRGLVSLYADGPEPFATFEITGEVFSPIAIEPKPVIFLVSTRGKPVSKTIELVNQTGTPFKILEVFHNQEHFSSRLETLEEDNRYRLVLSLAPDGSGGRQGEQPLLITTSHPDAPELRLVVNTYLRERIYTFPDVIDMGAMKLSDIQKTPDLAERLAQTLMIYKKGTTDFEITVDTDLQFLKLIPERGPDGDRYEITVSLNPEKITPGKIQGNIILSTNDAEFKQLKVAVTGFILDE